MPDCLAITMHGSIAVLTLNRPEKRNALSDELVLGLQKFFDNLPTEVRAVVMQGQGGNFCAGLDLNELQETNITQSFQTSKIGQRLNDTIQFSRVPVISVLQGAVIGGGLELAASTHVRVAEPSAYYALPEGTRGIFLGSGGSVRLPRIIGASAVIEMMLTDRVLEAKEAHDRMRLTHYLVQEGQGLEKALTLAEKITNNAPLANFAVIQAIPRIAEQDPAAGMFTEMLMVGIAQDDEEAKRRLADFLLRKQGKVSKT